MVTSFKNYIVIAMFVVIVIVGSAIIIMSISDQNDLDATFCKPDTSPPNEVSVWNTDECFWDESKQLPQDEIDYQLDLHPQLVEHLVKNLIEYYDELGLDGINNAKYVAVLSGNASGDRYLYIVNPDTDEIMGQHEDAPENLLPTPRNKFSEGQSEWVNMTFNEEDGSLVYYKIYFVAHDGLIFTSGYQTVNSNGLPIESIK